MVGALGPATEAALIRSQEEYGLSATAVADAPSHEALNALSNPGGSTVDLEFAESGAKDGAGSAVATPARQAFRRRRRLLYEREAVG